jgi:hypothetical protein
VCACESCDSVRGRRLVTRVCVAVPDCVAVCVEAVCPYHLRTCWCVYSKALAAVKKDALLSRFKLVAVFVPFTKGEGAAVVHEYVAKLCEEVRKPPDMHRAVGGVDMRVTRSALEWFARQYSVTTGARGLRTLVYNTASTILVHAFYKPVALSAEPLQISLATDGQGDDEVVVCANSTGV